MQVKSLLPVFIGYTKSFWFAFVPAAITGIDMLVSYAGGDQTNAPVATALAWLISLVFKVTPEQIFEFMARISPLWTGVALFLRRGITRPYVLTPAGEVTQPAAVLVKEVPNVAAPAIRQEVQNAVSTGTQAVGVVPAR